LLGVGAVAAAVIVGLAVCAALALTGVGAVVCLAVVAIVAFFAGMAGNANGSLLSKWIGSLVDRLTDFDDAGDDVKEGDCVILSGVWVTDTEHTWNEIHD